MKTEPKGWGPDGRQAAVSLTFDNLGEAAEIERGLWPDHQSIGTHPSVTKALPQILRLLDKLDFRATFFVEGVNTETYPEELASIAAAGHEVGYHAWCHERWHRLKFDEERQLLERGLKAMERLGIRPRGFRPPGGRLNDSSLALLREFGFNYCSPEGDSVHVKSGVTVLPFRWSLIDAYFYYEPFAELREAHGDHKEPLSAFLMRERVFTALEDVVRDGGYLCLLFHPFLLLEGERQQVLQEILEVIHRLVATRSVWYCTCEEAANHVLSARTQ